MNEQATQQASEENQNSQTEAPKKKSEEGTAGVMQVNPFVDDLAALMFVAEEGKGKNFKKLGKEKTRLWHTRAASALVALDKMNKQVVAKGKPRKEQILDEQKTFNRLKDIIVEFVKGIKTVKCPRCKGEADIRPQLFPCTELAHRILAGNK